MTEPENMNFCKSKTQTFYSCLYGSNEFQVFTKFYSAYMEAMFDTLNGVPLNIDPAPGDFNLDDYISFN